MPITGRTPNDCFDHFRDHMAQLVTAIVPTHTPLLCVSRQGEKDRRVMTFKNPARSDAAEIETSAGTVFLHITQQLLAAPDGGGFRLRTVEYRYALYSHTPAPLDEPVFRWEYVSRRGPTQGPPRHHLQFGRVLDGSRAPRAQLSGHDLDLNRLHIPTGWVLLEEIFRFMIHELGMKPPCGNTWEHELYRSEKSFFEDFTSKRFE